MLWLASVINFTLLQGCFIINHHICNFFQISFVTEEKVVGFMLQDVAFLLLFLKDSEVLRAEQVLTKQLPPFLFWTNQPIYNAYFYKHVCYESQQITVFLNHVTIITRCCLAFLLPIWRTPKCLLYGRVSINQTIATYCLTTEHRQKN